MCSFVLERKYNMADTEKRDRLGVGARELRKGLLEEVTLIKVQA